MKTKSEVDWEMVLKISRSQGLSKAYFLKVRWRPSCFNTWPNVNSVHPLDNIKTKFEEDLGNSSKDITFTSI